MTSLFLFPFGNKFGHHNGSNVFLIGAIEARIVHLSGNHCLASFSEACSTLFPFPPKVCSNALFFYPVWTVGASRIFCLVEEVNLCLAWKILIRFSDLKTSWKCSHFSPKKRTHMLPLRNRLLSVERRGEGEKTVDRHTYVWPPERASETCSCTNGRGIQENAQHLSEGCSNCTDSCSALKSRTTFLHIAVV